MKKCKRCNIAYHDAIRFCTNCGAELQAAAKPPKGPTREEVQALANDLKSRYVFSREVYFTGGGEKAEGKIKMASASYAALADGEIPILCVDTTVFGSADNGLLVTTRGIHIQEYLETYHFFPYASIKHIRLEGSKIAVQGVRARLTLSNSESRMLLSVLERIRQYIAAPHYGSTKEFADRLRSRYSFSSEVYFWGGGEKADKKINLATAAYAALASGELPLFCLDVTLFGAGDEGFLVTTNGVHVRGTSGSYRFVPYAKLEHLDLDDDVIVICGERVRPLFSKDETRRLLSLLQETRQYFLTLQKKSEEAKSEKVMQRPSASFPEEAHAKAHAPLIDLNQATESTLAELFFVNRILAKRIVAERGKNGGFRSIEDFVARMNVTKNTIAEIREKCCVNDLPLPAARGRERNVGRIIDF